MRTHRHHRLSVLLILVAIAGCRTAPATITTAQGRVAYQAEDGLDAIGALQHAVINARRANLIPTATMRTLVKSTMLAAQTINTAVDTGTGAPAAYRNALNTLQAARGILTPAQLQKVQAEFTAAETILAALAGGA